MKNQVVLVGCIEKDFEYSHTVYGERFYSGVMSVKRGSGKLDIIPLLVSEKLIELNRTYTGECVYINGEYKSHNKRDDDKNKVMLYVFINSLEVLEASDNINDVFLEGCICKPPVYRHTPNGREIADVMLAVNRTYGKSDYIPCILWGRNAFTVRTLEVGGCIRVSGRIQSREYPKNGETKTAYEVSVNLLEIC